MRKFISSGINNYLFNTRVPRKLSCKSESPLISIMVEPKDLLLLYYLFFKKFFVVVVDFGFFCLFVLGPHLGIFKFPGWGSNQTTADPLRSLTHWVKPGITPASSWVLVRFVTTEPWQKLPKRILLWRCFSPIRLLNMLELLFFTSRCWSQRLSWLPARLEWT